MRWQVLVLINAVLVLYLLIGGVVFWCLESRYDKRKENELSLHVNSTLTSSDVFVRHIEQLINYINNELDRQQTQTISGEGNTSVCLSKTNIFNIMKNWSDIQLAQEYERHENQWNFSGSIFFAMTVVTTIGYGNLVPRSAGSRAFCCLYAVLGIPLCLVTIVSIGAQLDSSARWIEKRIRRVHIANDVITDGEPDHDRGCLRSLAFSLLGAFVFLLVPAALFSSLQGWDYGTAVYFAVISLSTIGFGDYVAGINYVGSGSGFYRLLVGVWILMGLAWLAGVLSSLQESFQSLITRIDNVLACFSSTPLRLKHKLLAKTTVADQTATEVSADNAAADQDVYPSYGCYGERCSCSKCRSSD